MEERVKVLLIEDDPDYALLMSRYIDKACGDSLKYVVESAGRLSTGLSLLGRGEYDIVLLDLNLPDSRGVDTLNKLRAKTPGLPIVVLTNNDEEAVGVEAIALGAQDFLGKGQIDPLRLRRAIMFALERERLCRQMESLVEGSPDGMAVVDPGGRVLYINQTGVAMLGRPREKLIGGTFDFPATPGITVAHTLVPAPEKEICVEMRVSEIEWKGAPARLAALRDVTEARKVDELRNEVRERLRIDQLKDQLLNTVAHELRSPLSVVKAIIGTLRDGLAGPLNGDQATFIMTAMKHIDRLTRLLNNFLDLARIESRHARVNRRPVDALQLVREIAEGVRLANRGRPIVFLFDLPDSAPPVQVDADMIAQVLSNLLDNAIRYARARVLVRATDGGECLEVSVVDDGPGIPSEKIDDLFNKFVQLDRPRGGSGYKGTGLGLAISREIVTLNGGRIWAENASGRGACFRFTLPFAGAPSPQEAVHVESDARS